MSIDHQKAPNDGVAERVSPLAARVAKRVGCELAYVKFVPEAGGWILRVVIDTEGGVNVEQCAKVSRQLSALLDVEDFVGPGYTLEVSSPGLDRELLVAVDFEKYAGQRVRIETVAGPEGATVLRGKLRGLEGGTVLLDEDGGARLELPRSSISEARLEVEI
jgi:ribosome maturation factor RimP